MLIFILRDKIMKVYKSKYYLLEQRNSDIPVIVKGYKAKNERPYIIDDFNPVFSSIDCQYRLMDGHLPEHRPIVNIRTALNWLDVNIFSCVEVLAN